VAALAQFDGSFESSLRILVSMQVHAGETDLVLRLVEFRENPKRALEFRDALCGLICGEQFGAMAERVLRFARDLQCPDRNRRIFDCCGRRNFERG